MFQKKKNDLFSMWNHSPHKKSLNFLVYTTTAINSRFVVQQFLWALFKVLLAKAIGTSTPFWTWDNAAPMLSLLASVSKMKWSSAVGYLKTGVLRNKSFRFLKDSCCSLPQGKISLGLPSVQCAQGWFDVECLNTYMCLVCSWELAFVFDVHVVRNES